MWSLLRTPEISGHEFQVDLSTCSSYPSSLYRCGVAGELDSTKVGVCLAGARKKDENRAVLGRTDDGILVYGS